MKKEIWKDIQGAPGYQISTHANIRRKNKKDEWEPVPVGARPYYLMFHVRAGFKNYTNMYVHRELLKAFRPSTDPFKTHVCFKDGNIYNITLDNLYWSNQVKRMKRRYKEGGYDAGQTHWMAKVSEEDVIEMRKLWDAGQTTQADLARKHGVHPTTIQFIVNRKSWKHLK